MTSQDRALLCNIAAENIAGVISSNSFDDYRQIADAVIYCAALCLGEMTEAELRDFYTSGGLDLTEYAQFDAAQDVTSVWVAVGSVQISDRQTPSLVSSDTPLVTRLQYDLDLFERISQVKTDGVFFRDFVCTEDMV
jgi:hypothetical protein